MTDTLRSMILNQSQPLQPVATSEEPKLRKLHGIRVVMFDIYGTLLISGCGDIGTIQTLAKGRAFVAALSANGISIHGGGDEGVQVLLDEIAADHQRSRRIGVEHPEVDIVDIWRRTLTRLAESGLAVPAVEPTLPDFQRIALDYELRSNPVWPMRHARECLSELHHMGMLLGLISNAQFLTIEIWKTLLQTNLRDFLIDKDLQFYSYVHGHAKPGLGLFELAADVLTRRGIGPGSVLYTGNDMLNDMVPAGRVGFRTALFAGDARSLRRREGDPRVDDMQPDIILTDLSDLPKCIDLNCRN